MIDYEFKDLFLKQDIDKQILIQYNTGSLTNNEVHQEQFSLEESLCSEDSLVFGTCESSVLKFTASNVFEELKNKWLDVSTTLAKNTSNPFQIGRFKVYSDVPTADRRKREIVAYDALYDILKADVAEWYNYLLQKDTDTVTMKLFRNSFFSYFGIEQEEVDLPNDNMIISKTIQPTELSGKTVINAICEINGCFGHIGRDGKFNYVFLKSGEDWLYPSNDLYPSENLYPKEGDQVLLRTGVYIPEAKYENFVTEKITGLQIRGEENDIGATAGTTVNAYVIQDNFLVYGKGNDELTEIAENILSVIKDIVYRPFSTKAKGNPCVEVGDPIRLNSKNQIIDSYVLQRVLRGVQALRDTYTAEGTQYQESKANSIKDQIIQLKGRTNTLTRTVDETRSELKNLEDNTESKFTQTSNKISAEVTRATDAEKKLSGRIDLTATSVYLGVTNNVDNTSASIKITLRDKNGDTVDYDTGDIELTGLVSFSSLENKAEKTFINGDNIITGTLAIGKNIFMAEGATISWNWIDSPSNLATTDDIPNDEHITKITKDTVTSSYIKGLNLEVGNEITMGANAKISWSQVTDQPTIPTETRITEITNESISTATIKATQIDISDYAFIGTIVADGGDFSTGELSSKVLRVEDNIQMGMLGTIDAYGITASGTLKCGSLAVEMYGSYEYAEWQTVTVLDRNGNPLQINFLGTLDVG